MGGRVFGPVGVEEVGSTRYLDTGEIDFTESGVSDGWPCDFFQESGESGVLDRWLPDCLPESGISDGWSLLRTDAVSERETVTTDSPPLALGNSPFVHVGLRLRASKTTMGGIACPMALLGQQLSLVPSFLKPDIEPS